jgi:hypothetical protein
MWEESDTNEEAIAKARQRLAQMDEDDLKKLDFEVVDFVG